MSGGESVRVRRDISFGCFWMREKMREQRISRNTYIQQSAITGLVAVSADEIAFLEAAVGLAAIARLNKCLCQITSRHEWSNAPKLKDSGIYTSLKKR